MYIPNAPIFGASPAVRFGQLQQPRFQGTDADSSEEFRKETVGTKLAKLNPADRAEAEATIFQKFLDSLPELTEDVCKEIANSVVVLEDGTNASTEGLKATFTINDRAYHFDSATSISDPWRTHSPSYTLQELSYQNDKGQEVTLTRESHTTGGFTSSASEIVSLSNPQEELNVSAGRVQENHACRYLSNLYETLESIQYSRAGDAKQDDQEQAQADAQKAIDDLTF